MKGAVKRVEELKDRVKLTNYSLWAHYSILGWPTLPQRFLQLITQLSLSKHKLDIPFIALANHYIKNRNMIGDGIFETFKQFNLRELTKHYNETYTGRRDAVPILRQNNGA